MAPRRKQPLISFTLMITVGVLLCSLHFTSDLHSPLLFLIKAGLPHITVVTTLLFCLFAAVRRHWLTYSAIGLVCILNIPLLLPAMTANQELNNSNGFSIATFSAMTRTRNTADVISFLDTYKPDVMCIQELVKADRNEIVESSKVNYPFSKQNNSNQLTLSKYPLTTISDRGHYQTTGLRHPSFGNLKLVNVHLPRPYQDNNSHDVWKDLIDEIKEDTPTILCGDFNITPNNSLYDVLTYQMNFEDSLTTGYGFTFPNAQRRSALFGVWLRIDYIFSRYLRILETKTLNISDLSDHRAVLSYFSNEKPNIE